MRRGVVTWGGVWSHNREGVNGTECNSNANTDVLDCTPAVN